MAREGPWRERQALGLHVAGNNDGRRRDRGPRRKEQLEYHIHRKLRASDAAFLLSLKPCHSGRWEMSQWTTIACHQLSRIPPRPLLPIPSVFTTRLIHPPPFEFLHFGRMGSNHYAIL